MRVSYRSLTLLLVFFVPMACTQNLDIQGHRGARGLMPENTIPAFLHALSLGVTTLELDVVISKDSQVVVSHEPFLSSAICYTPAGETIAPDQETDYNLYQMTYEEIRQADCGSQGNARFPEQQKAAAYKPLLADVIDSVEQYLRAQNLPPVRYNIETKSTPEGDGVFHPEPAKFVALVLAVVREKNITDRTIIQSFDVRTLRAAREAAPEIPQALLIENQREATENVALLGYIPAIYSPDYQLVDERLRAYTRDNGMQLIPWTVNDPAHIERMLHLEVDGIISDYPDRVIKMIQQKK